MLLTLASCEEDMFDYSLLRGEWRIEEATPYNGLSYRDLPYREGDRWRFYDYGGFLSLLTNGQTERGTYNAYNNRVYIDLDGDNDPDLCCRIIRLSDNYLSLEITDYGSTIDFGHTHSRRYKLAMTYRR